MRPGCPGAEWVAFPCGDDAPGPAGQPGAASGLGSSRTHSYASDTAARGQDAVAGVLGPSETRVRAGCVAGAVCQESGLGLWLVFKAEESKTINGL